MSYNESLSPNSNYPRMSQSEWDNAPFNCQEPPEKEFEVDVTYTMAKTVSIATSDYVPSHPIKDEGIVEVESTADTDWKKAYESRHYTIGELLHELSVFVRNELTVVGENTGRGRELKRILEDCEGWKTYDEDFTEI